MTLRGSNWSLRRLLREPIAYFSVAAALLFLIHEVATSVRGNVVVIDPVALEVRLWQLEAELGRPLSEAERLAVESRYVDEQILVREARSLELNQDERIDEILVQRMLDVLSADAIHPEEEELQRFYAGNLTRYTAPPSRTLTEVVVFGSSPPVELEEQLSAGVRPEDVGMSPALRRRELGRMTMDDLAGLVGFVMAEKVFEGEIGRWVGPFRSLEGEHWFFAAAVHEAGPRPLPEVRDEVRLDWIAEREAELLAERVAALRRQYTIRYSGSGTSR
jgi:hypothetical protein